MNVLLLASMLSMLLTICHVPQSSGDQMVVHIATHSDAHHYLSDIIVIVIIIVMMFLQSFTV